MSRVDLIREHWALQEGRATAPPSTAPGAPPPVRPGRQRRRHPAVAVEAPPNTPSPLPPPTPSQQLALDALSAAPAGLLLHELPRRVTIATMRVLLRQRRVAFADGRWTLAPETVRPAGPNPSTGSLP